MLVSVFPRILQSNNCLLQLLCSAIMQCCRFRILYARWQLTHETNNMKAKTHSRNFRVLYGHNEHKLSGIIVFYMDIKNFDKS